MRRSLIVEDDPIYIEILERVLSPFDVSVRTVRTAADAISALSTLDYDVILLDLHLGSGSTGAEVVDYVRRVKPHALGRIVAVTNSPGAAVRLDGDVPVVDKGNVMTLGTRLREILQ